MKEKFTVGIFNQFFNNSIDLLCIATTDGFFIKLNPEWEKKLGYKLSELEGQRFIDFVHPDDVEPTIQATQQLADGQLIQNFVNRYRHKDGSYRWIEWSSFPSEGTIFASAHDITNHVETEKALRESEERNQLILSLTTDYIFKFSVNEEKHLKLVYLSDNFGKIIGKSASKTAEPDRWTKLFHPDDLPRVFSFLQQLMIDAMPGQLQCRSINRGKVNWIRIIAHPEFDVKAGQVVSITGAVKDITDQINAESRLKASEELFLKAFLCSPDAVSITSCSSGKYIDVNEVFLKNSGYERSEIIDKTPLELNLWVNMKDRDSIISILSNTGHIADFETSFRIRSGEIKDCLVTGEVIEINKEKCFVLFVRDITEKKRVEKALRDSEAHYRALIETQADLVSRYLPDTTLTFVNDAYCRFFGKKREELIGESFLFMITPEYRDLVRNETRKLAESCGYTVGEYLNYRSDGQERWIQWAVQCIADELGKVVELQAVGRDITDLKNNENLIRQNEQKLSDIYKLSPNIVGIRRLSDGALLDANPYFTTLTGYTREEFLNKTSEELNLWADPKHRDIVLERIERDGEIRNYEFNMRKKDGTIVPCFFSGTKFLVNNEPCILYIVNDISKQKETEISLRESESRLRSFINESSEGIVIIGEDGRVLEWNKSAESITGYNRNLIIGNFWWDIAQRIAKDDKRVNIPIEILEQKVRSALKTGILEMPAYDEYGIRHKSGETRHIQHNIFTIRTEKGFRLAGIFVDITRRIETERKLRLAEEKFSLAFKTSPDAVNINRLSDGLFIEINQGFTDLTGYTTEDVAGKTSMEIDIWANPADRQRLIGLLKEQGKVSNLEATFRKKNGSVDVGLMSATIITLQGEKCILSITRDITDRKQAEEIIRLNEARLKRAQEVGQIGYSEQLIGATETWASAMGKKIFGFPPVDGYVSNEEIKKCIQDLPLFAKSLKELIETGKRFDIEFPISPADGSPQRYIHTIADLERDGNGRPVKIISTFQDITSRKQTEEALQKRVLALTKPLEDTEGIDVTDLFNIDELQQIQDSFARATGVAALITYPDGKPLTKPSNFCSLCNLVRSTPKGEARCNISDATLGKLNPSGPIITCCLSAGLQGAGTSIVVGGVHVASWLIGQVRDSSQDLREIAHYADEIGVDRKLFRKALSEVPVMSKEQFEKVAYSLDILAKQLSLKAYQNIQQARFIAEQKKAQEALHKSTEQISGIARNIPGIVFQLVVNREGISRLEYISENALKYAGLDSGDPDILQHFFERMNEGDRTRFFESRQKAMETLASWEWDAKYNHPDGKTRDFHGLSQPRKIGDEYIFDGIIFDVTESKKAEKELADTKTLLSAAILQSPVPMAIVSAPDYAVRLVNEACLEILGVGDAGKYIGRSLLEIEQTWQDYDPDGNPIPISEMPLAMAMRGLETRNKEYYLKRQDGTTRWHLTSATPIFDQYGNIIAALLVFPDITEKKLAEKAFREKAQEMELLMKSMANAFVMWETIKDETGNIVNVRYAYINDTYEKFAGVKLESIIGKTVTEVFPETEPDWFDVFNEVARTGKSKKFEMFFKPTNSLYDCTAYLPWDTTDRICVVFDDITEKRKADEEFRKLAGLNQTILDTTTVGLAYVINRTIQWTNSSFYKLFGYEYGELVGSNSMKLYENEELYLKIGKEAYSAFARNEIYFTEETRAKRKDGSLFWVSLSAKALDSRNPSEGSIWMIEDITDRKTSQEKLRESEEKMQSIFRVAPTGIGVVKNRVFSDVNRYICEMSGYSKEELIGMSARILYPTQEDFDYVGSEEYRQITVHGTGTVETKWKTKDGSILDILLSSTPIDIHDHSKGVIFTALDITARKKAEENIKELNINLERIVEERTIKLNEAVRDLEAFAYSVSHDLRAPVRHIDGFIKLMVSSIQNPDKSILDYYTKITDATQRMSLMIDSMLAFSRLGRKELTMAEINLDSIVREIIDQLKPDIGKRKIKWDISPLPVIHGDKNMIKLVFENLLSNAIKYTSKKKVALIDIGSTQLNDGSSEIFIKDNGAGFNMTYSDKLFGVFQRLHSTDEFEGIGIGLANVKQIVEKHKGSVRAEGHIDKGATFYITLPRK